MPARPFPFGYTDPSETHAELARLREREPISRVVLASGHEAWLVTRYEDVLLVLGDPRFSAAEAAVPGGPSLDRVPMTLPGVVQLRETDQEDHNRLRRLVAPAFSAHQAERLAPLVERTADGLLEAMAEAGPPTDLVSALTAVLPIRVVCAWLDLPTADVPRILTWNSELTGARPADEVMAAQRKMRDYMVRTLAARRTAPGDDLLSSLVAVHDEEGTLDEPELVGLGLAIVFVGHTSASHLITASVDGLLRRPEQWSLLRRHPELLPEAVEEMLRWHLVLTDGRLRVATEDVRLAGVLIRAGDPVVASINAANRDAAVYPNPDRFDPRRSGRPNLAFGHGIHRCLAAYLVRVELRVCLARLLDRFPELRSAAPGSGPRWKDQPRMQGMTELPVTW
ncbi:MULTISPECIES: cytochrome P450 [Kitasatospora]|uniref:Cytochrome P450 n=1 Tax=Kitasatospora cystarginea TaxID=58350 RepID=A0ABN3E8R5_9ACTN